MKNIDIARDSFNPLKNFSRVLKQQGRVELESDWNEQAAISLRCMRLMMNDLIGPYGGPNHDCGFRVLVPSNVDSDDGNSLNSTSAAVTPSAEGRRACASRRFRETAPSSRSRRRV